MNRNNRPISPESPVENNLRFPGQYYDAETGLHYNYHRYYDTSTGRYLGADPIGLNSEINVYLYVKNNPVNYSDPLGLWRFPDYISLNVNIAIPTPWTATLLGWSGQMSLDRYGNVYLGPFCGTIGKAATSVSGSLTAGWLNECGKPSEYRLKDFLSGHSFNIGGCYWGKLGETWIPGVGTATEVGLVTPQIGVSYHYSLPWKNVGFNW